MKTVICSNSKANMIVYGVDVTKHHQDIFHKHPFEILLENLKGIIFDKGIRKYYTILNIQKKYCKCGK